MKNIFYILNEFIKLRIEAYNYGPSLFNLATLRQMDEKRRAVGSFLLGNIKGIKKNELYENLGVDLSKEEVDHVVKDLIDMGYVVKFEKNKESFIKLSED